jgi:hypothetical protein
METKLEVDCVPEATTSPARKRRWDEISCLICETLKEDFPILRFAYLGVDLEDEIEEKNK